MTETDWVSPQKDPQPPHIHKGTVELSGPCSGLQSFSENYPQIVNASMFAVIVIISQMRDEDMTGDIRFTSEYTSGMSRAEHLYQIRRKTTTNMFFI